MADSGLTAQSFDQDFWKIWPADGKHRGRDIASRQA
jgi:hypothetical protein